MGGDESRQQYVLEIEWTPTGNLPRLVGPFGTKDEAFAWARLNVGANSVWSAAPLTYPYLRGADQ